MVCKSPFEQGNLRYTAL